MEQHFNVSFLLQPQKINNFVIGNFSVLLNQRPLPRDRSTT